MSSQTEWSSPSCSLSDEPVHRTPVRNGRVTRTVPRLPLALVGAVLVGGAAAVGGAPAPAAGADGVAEESQSAPPSPAPDTGLGGEETPRGAVYLYLQASREGDFAAAARYLDLRGVPEAARGQRGAKLARQLKIVLDQTLWIDLGTISNRPEGDLKDDLPTHRDRVGRIEDGGVAVEVWLDRVAGGPDRAPRWVFAASTVGAIPRLYNQYGYGWLGEWLPEALFRGQLFELKPWQWLGLALAAMLAYALAWLMTRLARLVLTPMVARTATTVDDRLLQRAMAPARLLLVAAAFQMASLGLALAVPVQRVVGGLNRTLALLALFWLGSRMLDVWSGWLATRLERRGRRTALSLVPMGRRSAQALLFVLASVAILQNLGVNVTGLVAGLGFGGLAFALAAQKSLENLFGGVTVIADQPVRVGDFCRFGDQVGTVEDVGLRSTRLRTLDRTVVTIPNSEFASMQLENFARRDKIWFHPRIGLRYETTPEQIRCILVELRAMLYAHPRVDPDPARVRFVGFGASSLDIDFFAYVLATDYSEYLEVAEDLNLRIMDIVEGAGSGFAFPSQTLYVGNDTGLDPEGVKRAEERVARWREEGSLCLPTFPPQRIAELADTLPYPGVGSATAKTG